MAIQIDPIEFGTFTLGKAHETSSANAHRFSSIMADTLYQAVETDYTNEIGNQSLVLGEDNSLHQTIIDANKADMAINLTVQIRNRLVEAYNEISRMQV